MIEIKYPDKWNTFEVKAGLLHALRSKYIDCRADVKTDAGRLNLVVFLNRKAICVIKTKVSKIDWADPADFVSRCIRRSPRYSHSGLPVLACCRLEDINKTVSEIEKIISASTCTSKSGIINFALSNFSDKELRMQKLTRKTTAQEKEEYEFLKPEEARLKQAMRLDKIVELPESVTKWGVKHFEWYFGERYYKLAGTVQPVRFAIDRKLIKLVLAKTHDGSDVKKVIDFVFDNWDALKNKFKFTSFPSISLIFSRWFAVFQNLLVGDKPLNGTSFLDKRADYKLDFDIIDKKEN